MRLFIRLGNRSCIALPTYNHVLVEYEKKSYASCSSYTVRVPKEWNTIIYTFYEDIERKDLKSQLYEAKRFTFMLFMEKN